jgi:DNA-binding CsgD family transcriptional regulator
LIPSFRAFRTKCRVAGDPSDRSGGISKSDITDIGYELAHCTDIDVLSDAIMEVLQTRLSYPRVALWVRERRGGGFTLVRSASGAGVGAPFCFMLEAHGQIVGRLDVELPDGEGSAEIIEQLLPCIAVALHGVLAPSLECADAASDHELDLHESSEELVGRIKAVARRWGLSPRQVEVLELVLQGQTNKEIANELGCQEGTIEAHVSQILKKSGSGNRATLVGRIWSES